MHKTNDFMKRRATKLVNESLGWVILTFTVHPHQPEDFFRADLSVYLDESLPDTAKIFAVMMRRAGKILAEAPDEKCMPFIEKLDRLIAEYESEDVLH